MGKKNILYVVYAGTQAEGCVPVYESTKEKKAESYAHDLRTGNNDYDKVFIQPRPIKKFDKRRDWRED